MNLNTISTETEEPDAIIGVKDGYAVRVPVRRSRAGRAVSDAVAEISLSGNRPALIFGSQSVPIGDPLAVSSDDFGFGLKTTNTAAQNNATLALIAYWAMTASPGMDPSGQRAVVEIPPGVFQLDGAQMDLTYRSGSLSYTPRLTLRGAGRGITIFRSSAASTAPAVLQIAAGYAAHVLWSDFEIETRTDIQQDGVHIYATRRTLDNTGGITAWSFHRVGVRSYLGDAVTLVGGDDYLAPNQFIEFTLCAFEARRMSSLKVFGQFGQVTMTNGWYDGDKAQSSAPAIALMQDLRITTAPSAVDTTNNFVTSSLEVPTGTPVRIVGTNLPSGLSAGTTYYVRRYRPHDGSGTQRLSLHSSRANVVSNTRVALGSSGTIGNWFLAPLYVTSVTQGAGESREGGGSTAGALNFEFPHHLVDCAVVQLTGSSVPTGLAANTDYWVIRRSALQIALASSKANALAGTAIAFNGGDVTRFGLSTAGFATGATYSVNMQAASAQATMQALYLSGADDVTINIHVEEARNSIYAHNSQLSLIGGHFANPADDGGIGTLLVLAGANTRFDAVGVPYVLGQVDNWVACTGGAAYLSGRGGFSWAGNSATTSRSVGMLAQYGAAATMDFGANDFVFVNASATQMTTFATKLPPKSELCVMAWGGGVTFGPGGNLVLPNNSAVTIPERAVATFKMVDTVGVWALVGKSA